MPVRIALARGDDGEARADRGEEGRRAGGSGAMMGDLQEVDRGQPSPHEVGIDVLLDVPGEEESAISDLTEDDDRDVVDRRAAIRGALRDPVRIGPQDPEPDPVEAQPVPGRQPAAWRAARGQRR
jgi:hypothetical protein